MSSQKWVKLRAEIVRKHPFCEIHEKAGIEVPATCIHHIREVESGQTEAESTELCYNPDNLIALCERCHKYIHNSKGYNTIKGQKKRAGDRLSRWISKFAPAAADSVEAPLPSGYSLLQERQRIEEEVLSHLLPRSYGGEPQHSQRAVGTLTLISIGTIKAQQEKSPHGADTGLSG